MAKVTYNRTIASVQGKIQGLRFSKRGKQNVVSPAPDKPTKKRKISEQEEATRVRTMLANSYSRSVKNDPDRQELWARYKAVSVMRGCPSFAVSNKDFNNPPVVDAIDAAAYRGAPGQLVRVRAHDDFEVRDVTVTIKFGETTLESGLALRQPDDTWHYTATTTVDATQRVAIEATARDWPNHTATKSITVDLSAPATSGDSPRGDLVQRIKAIAKRRGSYLLKNGETRINHFDKYRLSHSPDLLRRLAEQLIPLIPPETEVLAGLELGGVPLAAVLSQLTGKPLVLLRKEPRGWGTTQPAEGGDLGGRHILPIADVVTTGEQLANATRALRSAGAILTHALCLLDEQSGAPLLLQKQGIALTSLFTSFELIA